MLQRFYGNQNFDTLKKILYSEKVTKECGMEKRLGVISNYEKWNVNDFKISFDNSETLLKQAIEIDKQVFAKKDVGSFDMCARFLKRNKDMYTFLLYKNSCVGYINFCRVQDKVFEKFCKGNMKDYELTEQDVLPFSATEKNKTLFMSIALKKEFRDSKAVIILTDGFYQHLEALKKQGIYIDEAVADCVSVDGIKYVVQNFGAKYISDSRNGKIYYLFDLYARREIPKIQFELLSQKNLNEVAFIQYEIFKNNWCGYCDLLQEVKERKTKPKDALPVTYAIKYKHKIVGIIGLNELKQYPQTIWLNWFGIMPSYRRKGIGTHALFKIINLARTYNKKEFRLITYKVWNVQAQSIYQKTMQRFEDYTNADDWQYAIQYGKPMIFSSSLVDKRVSKWNNKFVDLLADKTLHEASIKKLKEDGLIE